MFEIVCRNVRTNSILKSNYIYSIYVNGKIKEKRITQHFESKIKNILILV